MKMNRLEREKELKAAEQKIREATARREYLERVEREKTEVEEKFNRDFELQRQKQEKEFAEKNKEVEERISDMASEKEQLLGKLVNMSKLLEKAERESASKTATECTNCTKLETDLTQTREMLGQQIEEVKKEHQMKQEELQKELAILKDNYAKKQRELDTDRKKFKFNMVQQDFERTFRLEQRDLLTQPKKYDKIVKNMEQRDQIIRKMEQSWTNAKVDKQLLLKLKTICENQQYNEGHKTKQAQPGLFELCTIIAPKIGADFKALLNRMEHALGGSHENVGKRPAKRKLAIEWVLQGEPSTPNWTHDYSFACNIISGTFTFGSLSQLIGGLEWLENNAVVTDCQDNFNRIDRGAYRNVRVLLEIGEAGNEMLCELQLHTSVSIEHKAQIDAFETDCALKEYYDSYSKEVAQAHKENSAKSPMNAPACVEITKCGTDEVQGKYFQILNDREMPQYWRQKYSGYDREEREGHTLQRWKDLKSGRSWYQHESCEGGQYHLLLYNGSKMRWELLEEQAGAVLYCTKTFKSDNSAPISPVEPKWRQSGGQDKGRLPAPEIVEFRDGDQEGY